MISWFRKKTPTISFKSLFGNFAITSPVECAKKIDSEWQKELIANKNLNKCPGLTDFYDSGYIISAHCDIHIKANKTGVICKLENLSNNPNTPADQRLLQPGHMDPSFSSSVVSDSSVKKIIYKVPLPWYIQTKPGYSAYVLPSYLHHNFSDKIFVYPGIVDYDKGFGTTNFIFSPLKECEFIIRVGTPLLHVLPYKREKFTAECDKATIQESDMQFFGYPSRARQYYRRHFWSKKEYTMECPYKYKGRG